MNLSKFDSVQLSDVPILTVPATVRFDGFEGYKALCLQIKDILESTEVTDDSIKDAKKLVANARRIVDGLGKRKVEIKRSILSEYSIFESQVKELQQIVDEADKSVRVKINELEELEKDKKLQAIKDIFDKQSGMYKYWVLIPDCFESSIFEMRYLNKSMSLSKVEADMVSKLDQIDKDVATIKELDCADDVLYYYIKSQDLAEAISTAKREAELKASIRTEPVTKVEPVIPMIIIKPKNGEELGRVVEVLTMNNIRYEIKGE